MDSVSAGPTPDVSLSLSSSQTNGGRRHPSQQLQIWLTAHKHKKPRDQEPRHIMVSSRNQRNPGTMAMRRQANQTNKLARLQQLLSKEDNPCHQPEISRLCARLGMPTDTHERMLAEVTRKAHATHQAFMQLQTEQKRSHSGVET